MIVKLSPQRKAVTAVLGLALVGLIVDRLVLPAPVSGPDAAEAAVLDGTAPVSGGPGAASGGSASGARGAKALEPERESVRERIAAAALAHLAASGVAGGASAVRDPFSAPVLWRVQDEPKPVAPVKPEADVSRFHPRISGVIKRPDGVCALVNGALRKVGDVVDGFTIVEIHSGMEASAPGGGGGGFSVVFEKQGRRVTLTPDKR